MINKKTVVVCATSILLIIAVLISVKHYYDNSPIEVNKKYSDIDLSEVNKVMFIAHPDDDLIWGGAHLLEDDYLVVCITCGNKRKRVDEFTEAMALTNSKYIMLGYPDKIKGKKDKWETSLEGIKKDIKDIIDLKDWDMVVTHNPDGEYGHIHHIMTNEVVTNISDKSKLMYFGKYYKKEDIEGHASELEKIDKEIYDEKFELLKVYKSQEFIFDMFGHMFYYENWISYEEWYNEK